jgi:hypothetical protein
MTTFKLLSGHLPVQKREGVKITINQAEIHIQVLVKYIALHCVHQHNASLIRAKYLFRIQTSLKIFYVFQFQIK